MSETSDIVAILIDQADRLFTDRIDRNMLAKAEGGAWPGDVWSACYEMGLSLILLPEESGGVGLPWSAAARLFMLLGQHCVPLPIGETAIAAMLLADAGLEVPDGPLTFAATTGGGNEMLTGVPWARDCGHLVLVTADHAELRTDCLRIVPEAVRAGTNIAREPRDAVSLAGLQSVATATRNAPDANPAMLQGALLRAAQMAGALRAVTMLSVEHTGARVQFGKPLAAFQAMQQSLAALADETAAAEVAALMGAAAFDRGHPFLEVASAKIRSGEAAGVGSALGHQAHGAIGFTDEYSLHYRTRRLLSWRDEFGSERYWARELGNRVLAADADLWHIMTDPSVMAVKNPAAVGE